MLVRVMVDISVGCFQSGTDQQRCADLSTGYNKKTTFNKISANIDYAYKFFLV